MKRWMFVVGIVGLLSASSLVVKDFNVTVTVADKEHKLQKDEKLEILQGSKVCFKEGKGRIVIDNQLQLSSESNETCQTLAKAKIFDFEVWFKKNMHKVALLFGDVKEQVKLVVTRKGDECEVVTGTMVLKPTDEYLVIRNECWSPFDIKLEVLDGKNVVYSDVNSKNNETIFIISHKFLKDGYKVMVYDGFGGVMVDVKLDIE